MDTDAISFLEHFSTLKWQSHCSFLLRHSSQFVMQQRLMPAFHEKIFPAPSTATAIELACGEGLGRLRSTTHKFGLKSSF